MTYTPHPHVDIFQLWTAADHNTYIRDNINSLWAAIRGYPARAKITGQSISSGSTTIVQFDTETFDPDNVFTTGAAAKYTAPVDGYYLVQVYVQTISGVTWNSPEVLEVALYRNGSHLAYLGRETQVATHTSPVVATGMDVVYLAASQYVDIRVFQNSGVSAAITSTAFFCMLEKLNV